jgi:uncharacterized membrane protein YfcA
VSVTLGIAEGAALAGAATAAGAVNAVAGGGSLISFPALVAVGYPALHANVTNAVAVLPGYLGGSIAYRDELRGQGRTVRALGAASAAGAAAGTALLLTTPSSVFEQLAPPLVLLSSLLLAAQPWLARLVGRRRGEERAAPAAAWAAAFAAAIYGGYFGAGLGVMLLAVLGLLLTEDLQRLNALKGLLSLVIGLVTAASFALFGPVAWEAAAIMAAGSLAGGHAGVSVARRVAPGVLRAVVVVLGVGVAVALWAT